MDLAVIALRKEVNHIKLEGGVATVLMEIDLF